MGSPPLCSPFSRESFLLVAKAKGAAFRYVGGVTDPQSGDVDARTFESLIVAGFSFVKNCFFPSSSSPSFSLPGLRIIIWEIGIFRALNCRYLFNKFVHRTRQVCMRRIIIFPTSNVSNGNE